MGQGVVAFPPCLYDLPPYGHMGKARLPQSA